MGNTLANLTILVTRPRELAEQLADALREEGGIPIIFPTIEIVEPDDLLAAEKAVQQFNTADIAIFISHNAVERGLTLLSFEKIIPSKRVKIAAVGEGTAKRLAQNGVKVDIVPKNEFSSEGLLMHPALAHAENKKIILFRGEGGRTLLAGTLRERGADVIDAIVYRRIKPKIDMNQWWSFLERQPIGIIVTTSNDGLLNLFEMVSHRHHAWLYQFPLLVISKRMMTMALQLGFSKKNIIVAEPSDKIIVATIEAWYRTRMTNGKQ